MTGASHRNFRLQGIPGEFRSHERVRDLVKSTFGLKDDTEVTVHSLATNPLDPCSRTATFTLRNDQIILPERGRTEWTFRLPEYDEREPQYLTFDTHFRGLTPLHHSEDSECSTDLIATSGLDGHAFGSFKARGSGFMWLRDDLPVQLPHTRILVYGLNPAAVARSPFPNLTDLGDAFRNTVERLHSGPSVGHQIRPTIFLGHSLGGLVIKEAITTMRSSGRKEDGGFLEKIIACMFFGVPHRGMSTQHLVPIVGKQPNRAFTESLGVHSAIFQRYANEFPAALASKGPARIISFFETETSPVAKFDERSHVWQIDDTVSAILVDRSSATDGSLSQSAIARNHSEMVKFTSQTDQTYDVVLASLIPLLNTDSGSQLLPVRHIECLNALAFKEKHLRRHEVRDAGSTCGWLLNEPHYQRWISQPRGLLWIRGRPGSGKSMLMKYAFENAKERASALGELVLSYFVHGCGVGIQKSRVGISRALLHGLLPHFGDVLAEVADHWQRRWEWEERELEEFLLRVLTDRSRQQRITIFIDGLDECERDAPLQVLTFLQRLGKEIEEQKSWVRICFSSRRYNLLDGFDILTVPVEKNNRNDIRRVTEEKLRDVKSETDREIILYAILSEGRGVFQWTGCVAARAAQKYQTGSSVQSIQREIECLPTALHELYERFFEDDNAKKKEEAAKLFRWVLFAWRPLSVPELREALAIDPPIPYKPISELRGSDTYAERFESRVSRISKGLVHFRTREALAPLYPDVEGGNRQAEFVHHSVLDFLLQKFLTPKEASEGVPLTPAGIGHRALSLSCLRYLAMPGILRVAELSRAAISLDYPLAPYAVRYLFSHLAKAQAEQVDPRDVLILYFDDDKKRALADLWRTFDPHGTYSPLGWPYGIENTGPIAEALRPLGDLQAMIAQGGVHFDLRYFSKITPLVTAIKQGRHGMALDMLLRTAEYVDQNNKSHLWTADLPPYYTGVNLEDCGFDTPMSAAVSVGASALIWALIEAGAYLTKRTDPDVSPVLYAIRTKDRQLLNRLIERNANLDGAVYYATTHMSGPGDEEIETVRILLRAGAATRTATRTAEFAAEGFIDEEAPKQVPYGSAARVAAERVNLPLLELLLNSQRARDELNDCLEIAVEQDHPLMAEMLLRYGAQTPRALESSVRSGRTRMTGLLLRQGPPENISELLFAAIAKGDVDTASLILNHQAIRDPVTRIDFRGCLVAAARAQSLSVAEHLFKRGILNWILGPELDDALEVAVENRDVLMAELLLRHEARFSTLGQGAEDALMAAITNRDGAMAQLLINHGVQTQSLEPKRLHNHLVSAVRCSVLGTAQLLLSHGAEFNDLQPEIRDALVDHIRNNRGTTAKLLLDHGVNALAYAVRDGAPFAVHQLLTNGTRIFPPERKEPHIALMIAVRNGDLRMVEILLGYGARINFVDGHGFTPLHIAASRGDPLMAEFLLSHGASSLGACWQNWVPLYSAVTMGHLGDIDLLLSRGASPHVERFSPLGIAVSRGNPYLVEMLVEHGASLHRMDRNGRTALGEAILRRNRTMLKQLIQLLRTLRYRDSLKWPPEYPTEEKMIDVLASSGLEDHRGVFVGIVNRAILRGNEELVEFMLKYAGVGSDAMTGKLDWHPGDDTGAKLTELRTVISEAMEPGNDGSVAPIIVAVAFNLASAVKLLLEMGGVSEESLSQARFLVTSLHLQKNFPQILTKRPDSRSLSATIPQLWPFSESNVTQSDFFCRFNHEAIPSIPQWYSPYTDGKISSPHYLPPNPSTYFLPPTSSANLRPPTSSANFPRSTRSTYFPKSTHFAYFVRPKLPVDYQPQISSAHTLQSTSFADFAPPASTADFLPPPKQTRQTRGSRRGRGGRQARGNRGAGAAKQTRGDQEGSAARQTREDQEGGAAKRARGNRG